MHACVFGPDSAPEFVAVSAGLAIFGAAFTLSRAAEAAQIDIPESLSLAFLALVAVLPEYAVDIYFARRAGTEPRYVKYATANMTGANCILIGRGWPVVVFAYAFVSGRRGFASTRLSVPSCSICFCVSRCSRACRSAGARSSLFRSSETVQTSRSTSSETSTARPSRYSDGRNARMSSVARAA